MITSEAIEAVCRQIVEQFDPERIILFGSYAYGNPTDDSDVDMLVVLPFEGKSAHQTLRMLSRLEYHFPLDLLSRTPEQVADRLALNDFFMQEIDRKGKVLYERPDARMGRQS